MNPLPLIGAFVVQNLIIVAWSITAHRWYLHTHPPVPAVLVCDEYRMNMDHIMKNYDMDAHFKVTDIILAKDVVEDIPSSIIKDAGVVFICGLHSHERNIIVKYCVAHNIASYVIPRVGDVIMSGAERYTFSTCPCSWFTATTLHRSTFSETAHGYHPVTDSCGYLFPIHDCDCHCHQSHRWRQHFLPPAAADQGWKEFDVLKFRSMRMDAEKTAWPAFPQGKTIPALQKWGALSGPSASTNSPSF